MGPRSRENDLGWQVDQSAISNSLERIRRYAAPPPEPQMAKTWREFHWQHAFILVLYFYIRGDDEAATKAARDAVAVAEDYFFGDWRREIPPDHDSRAQPNPEYWHQQWAQDERFVESACYASCLGNWDFVHRAAQYMSTIRWREIEFKPGTKWIDVADGREESAWRLALAGVICGLSPDDDLKPLTDIVNAGYSGREKLLLAFLLAIIGGSDHQLQYAATTYFEYYLNVESRQDKITSKIMVEGTLLVNYARRRERPVAIPNSINGRYMSFQVEGSANAATQTPLQ